MRDKESITHWVKKKERYYLKIFDSDDIETLLNEANSLKEESSEFKRLSDSRIGGLSQSTFNSKCAKLLLGVAVERFIYAVYLKRGYTINTFKNYEKKPPRKLGTRIPELRLTTQKLSTLIENLEKVLPKNNYDFNKDLRKGLELVRIWRNGVAHTSGNGGEERITDWKEIGESLKIINSFVFSNRGKMSNYK